MISMASMILMTGIYRECKQLSSHTWCRCRARTEGRCWYRHKSRDSRRCLRSWLCRWHDVIAGYEQRARLGGCLGHRAFLQVPSLTAHASLCVAHVTTHDSFQGHNEVFCVAVLQSSVHKNHLCHIRTSKDHRKSKNVRHASSEMPCQP